MKAPRVVLTYEVENMDCADCVRKVESALKKLPEVEAVEASYGSGKVRLVLKSPVPDAALKNAVEPLGYRLKRPGEAGGGGLPFGFRWAAVSGALYALAWAVHAVGLGAFVFALPALVGVAPLAYKAARGFRQNPVGINTLVTIATLGALFIGAGAEAAAVVVLFLIGEGLEAQAARQARKGLKGLAELLPQTALRLTEGGVEEVPASALKAGDRVRVMAGGRLPADGVVIEGKAEVDEAFLTGESVPVLKQPGDPVYAGGRLVAGGLVVEVKKNAEAGLLAEITRLAEAALAKKGATERFIDRFSRYYTPGVLLVAALVAAGPPLLLGEVFLPWLYKGLALLLIGCPCALVLSVPAATAAAIARGARGGLLFKSAASVETLARVRHVAFDKTGTLTEGAPRLVKIEAEGISADEALALALALEAASDHPLARAIRDAAEKQGLKAPPATGYRQEPGVGVFAEVEGRRLGLLNPRHLGEDAGPGTAAVLVEGERVLARFYFEDAPRPEARTVIAGLRGRGLRPVLLSGDHPAAVARLAEAVGLLPGEAKGGLLPEDKLRTIESLRQEGGVAMVGDGINDSPALAAADVGVAVWSGTQAALDSADAAILEKDLKGFLKMVDLARRTRATMIENIAFALGLKGIFFVTTLLGLTGLWPAVLSDTGATVLVTLNSARLLGLKMRS